MREYMDARTDEVCESRWNLANPLKRSFFVWYMIESTYHAFAAAPTLISDTSTDTRARVARRYAAADGTLSNRAGYAFEMGTHYVGEGIAHAGMRLGQAGMGGYAIAHGGPVAPAVMQYRGVQLTLAGVTTYGAVRIGDEVLEDVAQGKAPKPGDLVDLVLLGYASKSSWESLSQRVVTPQYGPRTVGTGGQNAPGLSPILQRQKELTLLVNRQGAVVDRWVASSSNRWAQLYRANLQTNPNFAALIRGRVLDVRMRGQFRDTFGSTVPGVRIDQTIPGSGNRLRPDLYFPSINNRSVIFDVGSPSKVSDILKYEGMADVLIPLTPEQWFPR